jgi:EpsI family protein
MLRVYRRDDDRQPSTDLFMAYFPSQRAGDTIHSPKNCLPGAGWTPIDSSRISLSVGGHTPFPVNRYVIAKGSDRLLVLYWYWAHDRAVASEYWAKVYLVTDSIRMNRSDGALVRLNTRMLPGESVEAAMTRLTPFAGQVVPLLNEYIPQTAGNASDLQVDIRPARAGGGYNPAIPALTAEVLVVITSYNSLCVARSGDLALRRAPSFVCCSS